MKLIMTLNTKIVFCTLLVLFSTALHADVVTAQTSDQVFEGIKLTKSILFDDGIVKTELKSVSHGLRKKTKFGLITVSVYVAEFFAHTPTQLQKTPQEILNSLKSAGPIQLRLTMTRDLSGTQISESFTEALTANGIDAANTSSELKTVLTTLGEIKKFQNGETFSLTASWKDSNATLFIQKPDLSIQKITGPEKFVTDLFSIWFGKSADSKLEDLKKTLLK